MNRRATSIALLLALALPAVAQEKPSIARLVRDSTFGQILHDGSGNRTGMRLTIGNYREYNGALAHPNGAFYFPGWTTFDSFPRSNSFGALTLIGSDGSTDTTFGGHGRNNGYAWLSFGAYDHEMHAIDVQSTGRIIVAGRSLSGTVGFLAGYLPDGRLDPTFGEEGVFRNTGYQFQGMTVLPDDRIMVVNAGSDGLIRFTADGRPDASFPNTWMERFSIRATPLALSDGQMLAVVLLNSAVNRSALARFNADGTVDETFGTALAFTEIPGSDVITGASRITLGVEGRIYVAYASGDTLAVARFTSDGRLDPSFGGDGVSTLDLTTGMEEALTVVELPDGRVMAGGYSEYETNRAIGLYVMFNHDGTPHTEFGTNGAATDAYGEDFTSTFSWVGGLHVAADKLTASFGAGPVGIAFNTRGEPAGVVRYSLASLTSAVADESHENATARLGEPTPNPGSGAITLTLEIPSTAAVRVTVYDLLGRPVERLYDGRLDAGTHRFVWNDGAAGRYTVRAEIDGEVVSRGVVRAE